MSLALCSTSLLALASATGLERLSITPATMCTSSWAPGLDFSPLSSLTRLTALHLHLLTAPGAPARPVAHALLQALPPYSLQMLSLAVEGVGPGGPAVGVAAEVAAATGAAGAEGGVGPGGLQQLGVMGQVVEHAVWAVGMEAGAMAAVMAAGGAAGGLLGGGGAGDVGGAHAQAQAPQLVLAPQPDPDFDMQPHELCSSFRCSCPVGHLAGALTGTGKVFRHLASLTLPRSHLGFGGAAALAAICPNLRTLTVLSMGEGVGDSPVQVGPAPCLSALHTLNVLHAGRDGGNVGGLTTAFPALSVLSCGQLE